MTQDELKLLNGYLNETISDEELPVLQFLLRESVEARKMFRSLCTVDAKLQERAAGDPATLHLIGVSAAKSPAYNSRASLRSWLGKLRPLTAAAAGLVIGLFSATMVFAYASPSFNPVKTAVRRLWSDSFESGTLRTLPGLPRQTGVWTGDEASVVEAEMGLKPKRGVKMMRFINATFTGENAEHSVWGDVYRLVDVSGQVSSGKGVLRLAAVFNCVPFPEGEEYSGKLELCALEDDLKEAPQPLTLPWVHENSAAIGLRKISLKGDGSWQGGTVEVPVSPRTRFVLVHLAVHRQQPLLPGKTAHFSGHYLDDVKIDLHVQPIQE
ncbi:hypothetical protein EI77_03987 [Prosthecobacter fusiformis]|uniref:Uncharacterized protein n=1 Tax=Prosthecobacter fusiformis TaxID=48464 RepID=A0A4R7RK23_9BACT|nr:hypothetical protein [Prosthecobacter fusiformis]TDU64537.1 hypothetical protein EI77_03987 [Prosthecobacter fusiformis]